MDVDRQNNVLVFDDAEQNAGLASQAPIESAPQLLEITEAHIGTFNASAQELLSSPHLSEKARGRTVQQAASVLVRTATQLRTVIQEDAGTADDPHVYLRDYLA